MPLLFYGLKRKLNDSVAYNDDADDDGVVQCC